MSTIRIPERSAEAFERLRKGYHLSELDGALYLDVARDFTNYQSLFAALGLTLHQHPRGFVYLETTGAQRQQHARRLVAFVCILVEDLWTSGAGTSDEIVDVEQALLSGSHHLDRLPHLKVRRYREIMQELGIFNRGQMENFIQSGLVSLGFAELDVGGALRFRSPVVRILDLCRDVFRERDWSGESSTPASGNESQSSAEDADEDQIDDD